MDNNAVLAEKLKKRSDLSKERYSLAISKSRREAIKKELSELSMQIEHDIIFNEHSFIRYFRLPEDVEILENPDPSLFYEDAAYDLCRSKDGVFLAVFLTEDDAKKREEVIKKNGAEPGTEYRVCSNMSQIAALASKLGYAGVAINPFTDGMFVRFRRR